VVVDSAADLAFRLAMLVDVSQCLAAFGGPAAAQTAQRRSFWVPFFMRFGIFALWLGGFPSRRLRAVGLPPVCGGQPWHRRAYRSRRGFGASSPDGRRRIPRDGHGEGGKLMSMGYRCESEVEELLYELCVGLGFCVPPEDARRLLDAPPNGIDAFTDAVLEAEGYGDMSYTETRQMVREVVARHMSSWVQSDSS
jgi:hypothetical protein